MKRLLFIAVTVLTSMVCMGQVTYFDTNNFFLNYFTDTGYSRYDWRFEPLKTDKERGNLKGDVLKVVTVITDKTGRGFGENFTDTTYYNTKGNIVKIVALKKDPINPNNKFRPDMWVYEYDEQDQFKWYIKLSQVEMMNGKELRREVHKAVRNSQGQIIQEITKNYSMGKDKKWEEFGSGDNVTWTFDYDANGSLASGKGPLNMSLTYKNGQLTKMQEGTFKPVTYTYDATGRLTSFKYYMIDGWDDEDFYNEMSSTLTYNEHGDISKAVKETWECNSKWQRRRVNLSETYTFTYTYDEKGNWTKAVVYSKNGNNPRQLAFTINRVITYGN